MKSLFPALNRKIIVIFFLGFSSGIPFLLTLSTLTIWLKESGVSNTTIGLFGIVTLPYTLKFLWGPLVDRYRLPFFLSYLGQRRSWALFSQLLLMLMLLGLGAANPREHIFQTAFWAFGVALASAIQDIVIEAYRIEITSEDQRAEASASIFLGYRLGMLLSGAGALYLAALFSWEKAYTIMALFMGIGIIATLCSPKTKHIFFSSAPHLSVRGRPRRGRFWHWIRETYGPPLRELLQNYDWRIVLAFIFFYKIGDTTLNAMSTPFLVDLGFSKLEIANVAKLFGISAMFVGGVMGGLFLKRFGIMASLMLCAVLHILSSLMFVIQALVGHDLQILMITIGVENLTCGFAATAFITYLSSLCSVPHTATHFALLSSFGSMSRIVLTIGAGRLADLVPWAVFFTITAVACIPFLILLIQGSRHFDYLSSYLKPQTT